MFITPFFSNYLELIFGDKINTYKSIFYYTAAFSISGAFQASCGYYLTYIKIYKEQLFSSLLFVILIVFAIVRYNTISVEKFALYFIFSQFISNFVNVFFIYKNNLKHDYRS